MSKTKQRCIVVTAFDENQPGYLDFAYRINALARVYDVTLVLKRSSRPPEIDFQALNVQIVYSAHGKLGWLRYLFDVAKYIRQQSVDFVVLLHSALAPLSFFLRNIPCCVYWNEHPENLSHLPQRFHLIKTPITMVQHRLIYAGAKVAKLVMPIGEEHEQDLIAHGVKLDKIGLCYMGVSEQFAPVRSEGRADNLPWLSSTIQIVYVGSVSEARGRDVMLQAMLRVSKQLPAGEVKLSIIGASQDELAYCVRFIQEHRLSDYVAVHGRIHGADVPAILHAADMAICLWPVTKWNQFNPPTKLFEYLVAGLPVLASRIRTHTRYIQDGVNGWIFDYSPEALAALIQALPQQRAQLKAMQIKAKVSSTPYRWSSIEPQFLKAVEGLCH